jgi:hypothetical protein
MRFIFIVLLAVLTYQVNMLSKKLISPAWKFLGLGFIVWLLYNTVYTFYPEWVTVHFLIDWGWRIIGYFFLIGGFHLLKRDLDDIKKLTFDTDEGSDYE